MEEIIIKAKNLGIKFEKIGKLGIDKLEFDTFYFHDYWSNDEFEEKLINKINDFKHNDFMNILRKHNLL